MKYFIGIDSSTTATKSILTDETGKIISAASSEYTFETPQPLWSEQHPDLWWQATKQSIRKCVEKANIKQSDIKGIGLTGQMHGLVLLDEAGEVLRPAILWNDQRTQTQCDEIRSIIGKKRLIRITGNDALTGFTAPKILWVKEHEPEVFNKIRHILLPKDFVRFKLTGKYAVDRADGAGTILFDLAKRDWSKEIMKELGLDINWFPPTFEGTQITGELTAEAADDIGLYAGLPVFAGGGDQAAAAVGTGAVKEGIISISLGTSGVVFATTDSAFIEPEGRLHAFCHSVPGKWHLMGVMLSAGGSLRWFRDTFKPDLDYDKLVLNTQSVPPGSDGLLFMPYLTGERTPYPDPLARAGFIGATVRHGFEHFTKAVLEGVAFGLRDSYELMKNSGLKKADQIRVTGGGAKSPIWRKIIANVLGVQIATVSSSEGAAFGAALLAATGSGIYRNVEEACEGTIRVVEKTEPDQDRGIYNRIYSEYCMLYPALKDTFQRIPVAILTDR